MENTKFNIGSLRAPEGEEREWMTLWRKGI